jgi:hypothetical protein
MPNPKNSNSNSLERNFPHSPERQPEKRRQEILRQKLEVLKKSSPERSTRYSQPPVQKNLSQPNQGKIPYPQEIPANRNQKDEIPTETNKEPGKYETKDNTPEKSEEKEQFPQFNPHKSTKGNRIKFGSKTKKKKKKKQEEEESQHPLRASRVLEEKKKVVLNVHEYEQALFLILQHFRHSEENQ